MATKIYLQSRQEQAQNILDIFDESLSRLSLVDSEIGAIQRRLESASSMNMITYENIKQARSQLADADYAIELAEFTRVKILEQAGLSVLSQANSSARLALDLLKTLI